MEIRITDRNVHRTFVERSSIVLTKIAEYKIASRPTNGDIFVNFMKLGFGVGFIRNS